MASPVTTSSVPSTSATDERREWIRIDGRVLMEYRVVAEIGTEAPVSANNATPETISAVVTQPTVDLCAHAGESLIDSPVLPWIMKVDYLLEVILNSLAISHPASVNMARPMDVNLSGGGVGFVASREFMTGEQLAIKMILPPFRLIQTLTRVIRSVPQADGQGFAIATEFIDLKADDQEHLIRHILQTQAERLRARRQSVQ
ncbi:MAG: PilZ domain-containing protein [Nitrospira sp.]|nr:PilZ domain-containing protein [Nitrospira sp.]TKB91611.1 MAG: PilZ domain-containing protein [Nitrospira sp.]